MNRERATKAPLDPDDVISGPDPLRSHFLFLPQEPVRHAAMEEAILRSDADGDWLVYADWLQQRGDPLGAAIARCHAFGVGCARPNFLFVRSLRLTMRFCFWVEAELDATTDWLELVAAVLLFPQGRFLRSLKVAGPVDDGWLEALVAARPASLRHIQLGSRSWAAASMRLRRPLGSLTSDA